MGLRTSALVFSNSLDIALMDDIFWARKAFAASLESSLLQILEVMIRSSGIQLA